ncbi:MAG TPA: hypothetical protein PKY25_01540 [Bacilli bacterium]|nr:hypothetical protein [Bacilli bacterium]
MKDDKLFSLKEVAKMSGLSIDEAISDVCHCDLLYGDICEYHRNPKMKAPLEKWQDMSTEGDQNGISRYSRFNSGTSKVLKIGSKK